MGLSCWEQLGGVLAWEWNDPDLLSVHFLTVASYNLQHPAQFTDEAVTSLRNIFIEHLDNGTPVEQLRDRIASSFDGSREVRRKDPIHQFILHYWKMTIADVYLPDHPEGAAERVRTWAGTIRNELSAASTGNGNPDRSTD